jgi:sarcosine oxidase subunit gamma
MLERRSALATATPFCSNQLVMGESAHFTLTQIAGFGRSFEKQLAAVLGKLPGSVGLAVEQGKRTLMRIGPDQFWVIGSEHDELQLSGGGNVVITPLSHSRTRIFVEGLPARDVLAKGIPLDLHRQAFGPRMFAMTGLHHTPVLLHCVSENRFELYVLRTFALSIWEWLSDAALEYAT